MVRSCSAANCVNRQTVLTKRKGITFHRFPKEESRRMLWVNAVLDSHAAVGSEWTPSVHSSLCSQHFHDKQFDRTGQTVRLRDSAVPVIFSIFSYSKMPRHCSAPGCTARDSRQTRESNISFHRLPRRDDPRRNLWIANCRRTDPNGRGLWEPSSDYIYFCSKHFQKSCFELTGISGYRRLKEDAVPTIFTASAKPPRITRLKAQKRNVKLTKAKVKRKLDFFASDGPAPAEPADPSHSHCFEVRRYDGIPSPDLVNFHGLCPENMDIPADAAPAEGSLAGSAHHPVHPESMLVVEGGVAVATVLSGPLAGLELCREQQSEISAEICVSTEPAEGTGEPPRPVSPSTYMMRVPQPPGAYIQNEHSYHVGNALLWKKRAEAALEALSKVQRQLEACRRREQRLRLRISSLQQEHMRERRTPQQPDVREKLKEHLQVFELQLINDFV